MLYKYSDLWVLVWEYLYVVVHLIYMQFELKLSSYFACVGVVYLVPSRPRPNHHRSLAPCRRRHHLGEPLVLNLFVNKKSYLYDLDSYLYKFLTRTLFVIYSAMVLKSVPVGPRLAYDLDVVYYLL